MRSRYGLGFVVLVNVAVVRTAAAATEGDGTAESSPPSGLAGEGDKVCGVGRANRACFPAGSFALTNHTSAFAYVRSVDTGKAPTPTTIWLAPSFTYFFAEQLSFRFDVSFGYEESATYATTLVGAGVHAGYNVPISSWVSVWPQLGLAANLYHVEEQQRLANAAGRSPATVASTYVDLQFENPFVFFPAPHFFVGGGPRLSVPVSASQTRSPATRNDTSQRTFGIGAAMILGGWF